MKWLPWLSSPMCEPESNQGLCYSGLEKPLILGILGKVTHVLYRIINVSSKVTSILYIKLLALLIIQYADNFIQNQH